MPSLNIRNMSDTLMKRLKSEAALAGKTMREYVIGKLESTNGGGIPNVPRADTVPAARGRKPSPREPVASVTVGECEHGTPVGKWCGFCKKVIGT